jgi:short-subunit dehydrogenase
MNLKQKYGQTAMVAGASEGIGAAFSTFLAAEGMDLVLIARRPIPLQLLGKSLEDKYKINVTCIACDLSETDAAQKIEDTLKSREISILVYNAALSYLGPFLENPAGNHLQAARLNMLTPLNLVHFYGVRMAEKKKGAIILMSSLAGLQGSGYLSMYASTKAFNRILAESLWYEWKNTGVDIIGCCAGATATPGYKNTKPEKSGFFAPRVLEPEEVAKECLKMLGSRPSFITGKANRAASFIMQKILPHKMAVNIMGDTTRKMYRL